MVRENSLAGTVRAPIGPSRAKALMDHMQAWQGKVSNQWKTRANTHQAMMDEGAPRAYAEVYKNLRVREQDAVLSAADRKHLQRCTEFLSEELANALGMPRGEALEQSSRPRKSDSEGTGRAGSDQPSGVESGQTNPTCCYLSCSKSFWGYS
jgi:RNA polymerase-interacting CarD/CdnL/TRCF family regulator